MAEVGGTIRLVLPDSSPWRCVGNADSTPEHTATLGHSMRPFDAVQ